MRYGAQLEATDSATSQSRRAKTTMKSLGEGLTPEVLHRWQERNRLRATAAEIAAAEAPDLEVCSACGGGGWVLVGPQRRRADLSRCRDCTTAETRISDAQIPARYRTATLASFRPLAGKTAALREAEAWDGRSSLVLVGPVGTGKTHLACALLVREQERRGVGLYVSVPELLEAIRSRYGGDQGASAQAYMQQTAAMPLLLLDDLGAERATDWAVEQLAMLIDRRYRDELVTIITTNMRSRGALADHLGDRTASRIGEWRWVAVEGQHMRDR